MFMIVCAFFQFRRRNSFSLKVLIKILKLNVDNVAEDVLPVSLFC